MRQTFRWGPKPAFKDILMKLVLFETQESLWGVELKWVKEVLPSKGIDPLPNAQSPVAGLINVRGEVIPVVKGSELLSATKGNALSQKILLLYDGKSEIGLLVDSVTRIAQASPIFEDTAPKGTKRFIREICSIEPGHKIPVIDIPRLFEVITSGWPLPQQTNSNMQPLKEAT